MFTILNIPNLTYSNLSYLEFRLFRIEIFVIVQKQKNKNIGILKGLEVNMMSLNYFNPFFTVKVMDGLFIANQTAAKEQQFVMNNKFSLIINTCPRQFKILSVSQVFKVLNFNWLNSKSQLIQKVNITAFEPIFQEISQRLAQAHGILVVSDRGHSRSITFVLLYLMHRFGWDLFKTLQYLNCKKQNLEVRAAFLKLLVDYEKGLKKQLKNNFDEGTTEKQLAMHVGQQKKQNKWFEKNIKSQEQLIITNTFKNTLKKRKINQLNQGFREKLAKTLKQQKRSDTLNKNKTFILDKTKRSVQFSNEIEIITDNSFTAHIFPQYEQLSYEYGIFQPGAVNKIGMKCQITKRQHKLSYNQHQNHQKSNESHDRKNQKHNRKSINLNSLDKRSSSQRQYTNRSIGSRQYQQIYIKNQAVYQRQFVEDSHCGKIVESLQNLSNNLISQKNNKLQQKTNDRKVYSNQNQPLYRIKSNSIKAFSVLKNQKIMQLDKVQQKKINTNLLTSSFKKLKTVFIQEPIINLSSPKKLERKQERVLVQPKSQFYHQRQALQCFEQARTTESKQKRKISSTRKRQEKSTGQRLRKSQQKKDTSTAMTVNIFGRQQKRGVTTFHQKNRCLTPQFVPSEMCLDGGQGNILKGDFISRPASRAKSNSLRMANKKDVTSWNRDQKCQKSSNIFNVNINVNIGKLQMLVNKTVQDQSSKGLTTKQGISFKSSNQFDKYKPIHDRLRSNSSNDNYCKFSASQVYMKQNKDQSPGADRNQEKVTVGINLKCKKEVLRISEDQSLIQSYQDPVFSRQANYEGQNVSTSDTFSKKGILDKINRKLIKRSNCFKLQQHTKESSRLQNNFFRRQQQE